MDWNNEEEVRVYHAKYAREWREKNKDKNNEYHAKYRKENPEKHRGNVRKYRENNQDKTKEMARKYQEKNKDKLKEKAKEIRENNPEKHRESGRKYRKNNPDKVKGYLKNYRENNSDKIKEYRKKYTEEHREELNKSKKVRYYNNEWLKKTEHLLRGAIRRGAFESPTLEKRTGYSLEDFKNKIIELNGQLTHKGFTFKNIYNSPIKPVNEIITPDNMILIKPKK